VDEEQHISQFRSLYTQFVSKQKLRTPDEFTNKLAQWHYKIYYFDSLLNCDVDGNTAKSLWEVWCMSLDVLKELLEFLNEGTGVRPPIHLTILLSEIANLHYGVPSRLLRLDGVKLGDNMRSNLRHYFMLRAAAFLRRFMDRDGYGSQKAAAQKIAQALRCAGLRPPGGRADSAYTGRTIEGWLREVSQHSSDLYVAFQHVLKAERAAETTLSLEEELVDFAEYGKRLLFEPNDPRKKECA
jgi:hypothetical protein